MYFSMSQKITRIITAITNCINAKKWINDGYDCISFGSITIGGAISRNVENYVVKNGKRLYVVQSNDVCNMNGLFGNDKIHVCMYVYYIWNNDPVEIDSDPEKENDNIKSIEVNEYQSKNKLVI